MNMYFANKTFRGEDPTWANACVGDNGNPGRVDYAEGFATAANALLDAAIADRDTRLPVDTLVYPVCFTMRHAMELYLKEATEHLAAIGDKRGVPLPEFKLVDSHDLGLLWTFVKTHALTTDERLEEPISKLEEYVADVAYMDATGQVFRYPFDLANQKHLTNIGVINFMVLKRRFNEAELLLKLLNRTIIQLVEEYAWGACTKHLSRLQLHRIAAELPEYGRWTEPSFDEVKANLKAKYSIGSAELSKAINIIKARHEMAARIGIEVPIPGFSLGALERFFDQWCKANDLHLVIDPPPARIVSAKEIMDAIHDELHRQELGNELANELEPEDFAAIKALFYFDSEAPVSEAFELVLGTYQQEAAQYRIHPEEYRQSVRNMLSKIRVFERILCSLDLLGRADALEAVIARYGLEPARERLLENSAVRKVSVS